MFLHAFSSQKDGNMAFRWGPKEEVLRNRENFLQRFGVKLEDCVAMDIRHGLEVAVVDEVYRGKGMYERNGVVADGLMTNRKGLFLFLLTGDCLPIAFYDPKAPAVALVHVGRRNPELLKKVVRDFQTQYASKPENLSVRIGPGIHKKSYKLPMEALEGYEKWGKFFQPLRDAEVSLDLIGYSKEQLRDAGVLEENIEVSEIDTAVSQDFFSYYRAVRTGEPQGRFVTIAGLN